MVNASMWINADVLEAGVVRSVMKLYHCAMVLVEMMDLFVQDVVDAVAVTIAYVIIRMLDIRAKENANIVVLWDRIKAIHIFHLRRATARSHRAKIRQNIDYRAKTKTVEMNSEGTTEFAK